MNCSLKRAIELSICAMLLCFMIGCKKKELTVPGAASPETQSKVTAAETPSQENAVKDFIPPQGDYSSVSQCPVNGEKVVVGKDTPAGKYRGKAYYFCCPACAAQFKAHPEKY